MIEKSCSIYGIEEDKITIKPIEYHKLIIALERLTRFEYPLKKKNRVYREILFKNLIHPKISLKNYYDYPLSTINALVKIIWDASLEKLGIKESQQFGINAYIAYEETKTFSVSSMISDLLNSENISKFTRILDVDNFEQNIPQIIICLNEVGFKINPNDNKDKLDSVYFDYKLNFPVNIDGLLEHIDKNNDEVSSNIKRLIWINRQIKQEENQYFHYNKKDLDLIYKKAISYREEQKSKFPVKMLLLVEGITEEKLLPVFADKAGMNFDKKGIYLLAAGGKNQSARLYNRFIREINLPIFILLDADAAPVANEINKNLRKIDKICLIPGGEFEDILSVDLICRALNSYYRLTGQVSSCDFSTDQPRVAVLENLWKEKGFGEFHKAEFARIIAENIRDKNDISDTLKQVFSSILSIL